MTASLYIHIPFCAGNAAPGGKCSYCDFFSVPASENNDAALLDSFIDALLDDVEDQISRFDIDQVPTAYIGGGTPSVLGAARMERLLAGLGTLPEPPARPMEFTVEANPESADRAFLQACVNGGVNRISLGIQTFHEPSRRAVNRAGSGSLLEEQLALTAEYFPGAFSADLISGLPFQTCDILLEDITRLLAFHPAHVSLYSLTLEPETSLLDAVSLPTGDEADNLWILGRDALEARGLIQYEVSNFALPHKAGLPHKTCAHNIRYWRMENWLGLGSAASGTIIDEETGTGRRFSYPHDIRAYLAASRPRINSAHVEELDRGDLMRESLLMGFRYREGPDPLAFKRRFGCGIEDCIPQATARWRERGFFEAGQNDLKPSREGLLLLNSFLRDAFNELDRNPAL